MTKVMSRRTLREPKTSSSPPTTQTGKMSVSDMMMPCRPPMASDTAPMSTDPAKPPKTSEYTPNMAKQIVRISAGRWRPASGRCRWRGGHRGVGQELERHHHPELGHVERGDEQDRRRP